MTSFVVRAGADHVKKQRCTTSFARLLLQAMIEESPILMTPEALHEKPDVRSGIERREVSDYRRGWKDFPRRCCLNTCASRAALSKAALRCSSGPKNMKCIIGDS